MSARASGLENAPLFREEALARFRGSAWQPALLSKPVSGYLLAASAVVAGAGLVGFATTFEFARKEQVQGYLTPAAGWARVAAKSFGVVRRRHVAPGDRVQAGDVLLEVSSGDGLQRSLTVQERMIEEIDGRRATLDARLSMVAAEYRNNLELLTRQNESERHELARLNEEIGLSEAQVQIAQQRYRNGRRLLSSGALPQAGLVELEEEEQARRLSLSERRREAGRLRASLATNDARVERLTLERNLKQAAIQEQLHALAMESSRIRGEDSSRLLAPRDGLVATVRVRPGDSVRPGDILLDILPADSVLQARLFAPAGGYGLRGCRPGRFASTSMLFPTSATVPSRGGCCRSRRRR